MGLEWFQEIVSDEESASEHEVHKYKKSPLYRAIVAWHTTLSSQDVCLLTAALQDLPSDTIGSMCTGSAIEFKVSRPLIGWLFSNIANLPQPTAQPAAVSLLGSMLVTSGELLFLISPRPWGSWLSLGQWW